MPGAIISSRPSGWVGLTLAALFAFAAGCDFSAKSDLRKAEQYLKEADRLNAEFWAEKEYRKAQKAFVEAMDLEKVNYVNEARDKAAEAKDWAEEALLLTKVRRAEMEKEKERLGTYKP
ncbi:MAG: hypothetical protein FJY67_00325 [Calditrichaeota bacterium]|nr:hypothetical protein [Calditrichota bacterium]